MRMTRWVAIGISFAALSGLIGALSCAAQKPAKAEMTQDERLARGKLLSWTSGCNDCHTPGALYGAPDTTRLLSGSELGWVGPWGVTYPTNLTPDQATGIGSWTEEQIVVAIRAGHRPDGTPILPPMPWPSFTQLSDEDAGALAAYLKSIPAVEHKMPETLPPNSKPTGSVLVMPPPPAWDAKNLPPPPAAAAVPGGGS